MLKKLFLSVACLCFTQIFSISSDAPFISERTYQSVANWQMPIDADLVKAGDILYIQAAELRPFFNKVLPNIKNPFILITATSEKMAFLNDDLKNLGNPLIVAYAAVNCANPKHPKALPIPLGPSPDFPELFKQDIKKTKYCLLSSSSRQKVWDFMVEKPFVNTGKEMPRKDYIEELSKYVFAVSPQLLDTDRHRHWECLALGTIPIIESSHLDPLFYNLPVVIVESYEIVNFDLLEKALKDFKRRTFDIEKIFSDYWTDLLLLLQEKVRNGEDITQDVKEFKRKTYGIGV